MRCAPGLTSVFLEIGLQRCPDGLDGAPKAVIEVVVAVVSWSDQRE
jgi:hypothetical protein